VIRGGKESGGIGARTHLTIGYRPETHWDSFSPTDPILFGFSFLNSMLPNVPPEEPTKS
jgi:hypothetical protein